jgi:hypothetical protein
MVPGPAGSLYVSVPDPDGSVLVARLDTTGRPMSGWPIALDGATSCRQLLPAADGSLRILCSPEDLNRELNSGSRVFALDSMGIPLAGWPVDVPGYAVDGRLNDGDLTLVTVQPLTDVIQAGMPSHDVGVLTVGADGSVRDGVRVERYESCCGEAWTVGPDGTAYGVTIQAEDNVAGSTDVVALDLAGLRTGWPIVIDGSASQPAFRGTGQLILAVADVDATGHVVVLDLDRRAVSARSPTLAIETAVDLSTTGGCTPFAPEAPVVSRDGRVHLYSQIDDWIYALEPSLSVARGWPYRPETPLVRRDPRYVREDAYCAPVGIPAVGGDGVLYLPLQASDPTAGGTLLAVGPDTATLAGWPIRLRRAGAEFWSIATGADGTAYALAIELESKATSSATILAITTDSKVAYTTTIVDP